MIVLKAGCLLVGDHSIHATYTLHRAFLIDEQCLRDIAYTIMPSPQGILIFSSSRQDVKLIIRWGKFAIWSRLVYHYSLQSVLQALDRIHNDGSPSITKQMLQISVGGDPGAMMTGCLLPCQGLEVNPDIASWCLWIWCIWMHTTCQMSSLTIMQ